MKEQRDALITAVNGRVIDMPIETSTLESSEYSMLSSLTNEPTLFKSDTSADELALNVSAGINSSQKCPKAGSQKHDFKSSSKRCPKKKSATADCRSGKLKCDSTLRTIDQTTLSCRHDAEAVKGRR